MLCSPARRGAGLPTALAAAVTGDAHALDDGRPLTSVLLRGLTSGPPPTTADSRHVLSLGDRICLALARRLGLAVLTGDRVWAETDYGVDVVLVR